MKKRGVFAEKSNWNILKLLKMRVSEYGDKEFIRFDTGISLSFKSLDEQSDKLAYKLLDIGLKEDENVFCLLKNSSEFLISLFARQQEKTKTEVSETLLLLPNLTDFVSFTTLANPKILLRIDDLYQLSFKVQDQKTIILLQE